MLAFSHVFFTCCLRCPLHHQQGFSVDGLTGPAGNETSYINKCVWVEGDEGVEVTPIDGFEMRNMFIQNCG